MKDRTHRQAGRGALELLEESVHLLRRAPAGVLLAYYVGALPFVLALLYYWADMSRGSFAAERAGSGAFVLALLFLWMKTWQSVFAAQVRARVSGHAAAPWTARRAGRVLALQSALQPLGLLLLPLSAPLVVTFAWSYAFLQGATALASSSDGVRALAARAAKQAGLWKGQNASLLLICAAFGLFVFLNAAMAIQILPALAKMFLGIETAFTRSGAAAVVNSTFLASAAAVAWLCLDPLVKTAYVLRCFYGESLQTGEDLKAELRVATGAGRAALAAVVLWLTLGTASPLVAAAGNPPPDEPTQTERRLPAGLEYPNQGSVTFASCMEWTALGEPRTTGGHTAADLPRPKPAGSRRSVNGTTTASVVDQPPAADLDRAIEDTLTRREYDWRLPREQSRPADTKPLTWWERQLDKLAKTLAGWRKAVRNGLRDFGEWLDDKLNSKKPRDRSRDGGSLSWMSGLQVLLFVLLALVASAVAILFWRVWKDRSRRVAVAAQAIAAAPDLTDENVAASQLPEDGWLRLAREMMDAGNLRLALRALYLASLAHLAERELISIAKFKSNLEYARELRRRARALPEVQAAFAENVGLFDRVWYGMHEVTRDGLQQFQGNFERIRAGAPPGPQSGKAF